jgi:prepilin-type N-terminal cleavage/methylation domain-containing protein
MTRAGTRTENTHGFTMLELMMAMTIFSLLGMIVVMLMRQGMTIFVQGTQDSVLQDRMDTVLPQIQRRLEVIAQPPSFAPPPPPPPEEERLAGAEWKPPPPVWDRVRSGVVTPRDQPDESLKDRPCFYAAWIMDISGDRSDEFLRRAGERTGPDLKEYVPAERELPDPDAAYKPTGGRMEICYIAIPEDPVYPALLTLYEGFRTPIGGEGTLLDPANLDTIREIRERCRPIATGILHFGITWRRVFAKNWDATQGKVGEREAYVGSIWDSTRALDKQFALYKDELSLGDPSDDIFPAWARLEITLMGPTTLGLGRGETSLGGRINDDDRALTVLHPTRLTGPGPDDRMLKIDGEWIGYRVSKVDAISGKITGIDRGLRDTKKASHDPGADVYVGLDSRRDVRLLARDYYAREDKGGKQP